MKNRVVVGMLLWLTAVCTVAGLAWFAIDSAGKSVTALPISQSGVAESLPPSTDPTASVDETSTPSTAPTTSAPPTGVSTGALSISTEPTGSSSGPSASTSPSRTRSPSPSTTRPSPKPSPSRTRTDSRSGQWGSVTAGCAGSTLVLSSGVPADEWRISSVDRQKGVSAKFTFDGDHGAKVKVDVACSNGRPDIQVDSGD